MPDKISPAQFAKEIKEKFPRYKELEDSSLVAEYLEKFPRYKEIVDMSMGFSNKPVTEPTPQQSTAKPKPAGQSVKKTGEALLMSMPFSEGVPQQEVKPVSPPKQLSFAETFGPGTLGYVDKRQMTDNTGTNLSRKVQVAEDVRDAPERIKAQELKKELKRDEAINNTVKKALSANGADAVEFSTEWYKKRFEIIGAIEKEEVSLTTDVDGNPVYKRNLGLYESLAEALKLSFEDEVEGAKFENADVNERIKMADASLANRMESEGVPAGIGGTVGEWGGQNAILLLKMATAARLGAATGSAFGPYGAIIGGGVASLMALGPSAYSSGFSGETKLRYAEGLQKIISKKGADYKPTQQDKVEAMNQAEAQGKVAGLLETANVGVLGFLPVLPLLKGTGLLTANAAKKGFVNALGHAARNAARDVKVFGTSSAVTSLSKDISANINGYNTSTAKVLENALTAGGHGMTTALSFSLYHQVIAIPGYLKSATKNYLATLPREYVSEAAKELELKGLLSADQVEKMYADLDEYMISKKMIPPDVAEEHIPTFAGLLQVLRRLEREKSQAPKAFHPKLDKKINRINERLTEMLDARNPLEKEVDDLTGDTGESAPQTGKDIDKSREIIEGPELERVKQPLSEFIDKPIIYKGQKAKLFKDGETLVVSIDGTNREIELGGVEKFGGTDISKFGISYEGEVQVAPAKTPQGEVEAVDIADNNEVTVRGETYVNNLSKPENAITYGPDGKVISVTLNTKTGGSRTFRGTTADAIAYQITLKLKSETTPQRTVTETDGTGNTETRNIEAPKIEVTETVTPVTQEVKVDKATGFNEAGEKSKESKSPKELGLWMIENSETGDKIIVDEESYWKITKTNKNGNIEIQMDLYEKNEKGEYELVPAAVKLMNSRNKGTSAESINVKAASDIFEQQYTNSKGERITQKAKYEEAEKVAEPPVRELSPPPIEIEPISIEVEGETAKEVGQQKEVKSAAEFKVGDTITSSTGGKYEVVEIDGAGNTKLRNTSTNKIESFPYRYKGFELTKSGPEIAPKETTATEGETTPKTPSIFSLDGIKTFFHGSPTQRSGRLKTSTADNFGTGIYFSTNKEIAKDGFGENVTEVSLNIEKPVYTGSKEWNEVEALAIKLADAEYGKKRGLKLKDDETYFRYDPEDLSQISEIPSEFISNAAKELGYDSIIDKGSVQYENEVVVLDESKVQYEPETVAPVETTSTTVVEPVVEEPKIITPEDVVSRINYKNMSQKELMGKVNEIGEVYDARGLAMKALMNGAKIGEKSFMKETGNRNNTIKRRGRTVKELTANSFSKKEGPTVDEVAHNIWESLPDELMDSMDTQDIRNALIDIITEFDNIPDLRTAFVEEFSFKEMSEQDYMSHYDKFKDEIDEIGKEWEQWMEGEGQKEMEKELDEQYVEELINKYEKESATKDEGTAPGKEEGVTPEVINPDKIKKEGRDTEFISSKEKLDREYNPGEQDTIKSTTERLGGIEKVRELYEKEGYKEYGETLEQFILRKSC